MSVSVERARLEQTMTLCDTHADALQDALTDLAGRELRAADLKALGKADRRLLDQFAYRYTRLQDDMGARLIPAILAALGEDVATMPVIERLNRLEQLRWLPSADEWLDLRRIRNAFTHEYPEPIEDRFEQLTLAVEAAARLMEILGHFRQRASDIR